MPLAEYHTSDLINPCRRAVQLRHEGHVIGAAPSALYQGLVCHEALRIVHTENQWDIAKVRSIVARSANVVNRTLYEEGREPTEAVKRDMHEKLATVCEWVAAYVLRFKTKFAACTLIGCELPVRFTLEVDGQPAKFASHLDLLYRDEGEILHLDDFKSGEDAPTRAYLSRNKQFGTFWFGIKHGQVLIGGKLVGHRQHPELGMEPIWEGGEWVQFEEEALVCWIHIKNLLPFKKKTTAKDESGKKVEYKKGDVRPDNAVVREVFIQRDDIVAEELKTLVRMDRAGFHPTNPDIVRCQLCESQRWCAHFEEDPQQ